MKLCIAYCVVDSFPAHLDNLENPWNFMLDLEFLV